MNLPAVRFAPVRHAGDLHLADPGKRLREAAAEVAVQDLDVAGVEQDPKVRPVEIGDDPHCMVEAGEVIARRIARVPRLDQDGKAAGRGAIRRLGQGGPIAAARLPRKPRGRFPFPRRLLVSPANRGAGMALYLGIDGGGSGCRAAVADATGHVLGLGESGPANIATDPAGAADHIRAAAEAALAKAGGGVPAAVVLGLAGANAAGAVDRLRPALPWPGARIVTDAVAATRGALGRADGVVAAIGTGSVFALQTGGAVRQVGGWGLAISDEGSGAWLGRALLALAVRVADGRIAPTPLLSRLLADHGGAEGIAAFALAARPADFAALAASAAGSADPAADAVLAEATAEVAAIIDHLRGGADLPVVFLGGLGPLYAARLAGLWPIEAPAGSAVDGALALAREAE